MSQKTFIEELGIVEDKTFAEIQSFMKGAIIGEIERYITNRGYGREHAMAVVDFVSNNETKINYDLFLNLGISTEDSKLAAQLSDLDLFNNYDKIKKAYSIGKQLSEQIELCSKMNADKILGKNPDPDDLINSLENLLVFAYDFMVLVKPIKMFTDYVSESFIDLIINYANFIATDSANKKAGRLNDITNMYSYTKLVFGGNYIMPLEFADYNKSIFSFSEEDTTTIYTRFYNTTTGDWSHGLSLSDLKIIYATFPDHPIEEYFEEYAEWRFAFEFGETLRINNIDPVEYAENMKEYQDNLDSAEFWNGVGAFFEPLGDAVAKGYENWKLGMDIVWGVEIDKDDERITKIDVYVDEMTNIYYVELVQIGQYKFFRQFDPNNPNSNNNKVFHSYNYENFTNVTPAWYSILLEVDNIEISEAKNNPEFISLITEYMQNSLMDTAGVGEGLEEDNSTLPEDGTTLPEESSGKTIAIGDEVYLVDRIKNILKMIQGGLTGRLGDNDKAGVGEGLEEDNETLPESEAETVESKVQRMFVEKISESLTQAEQSLARAQTISSPLVLDVDNNDFETKAKTDGVYFDLDNNGFAEKTAWTSGDAFLTYDLNENGKIDNGGELFGNHTLVGEEKAADGFAALAQYDENADGIIDENDDIYHLMRLWNDDGDGVSEDGEFKTLEDMGVNSIDLNQPAPENATYTDATVSGVSNAEMADGTSRTVADFWFNVSTADTMQIYDGEFDA
jgi:hypothetical protein